MTLLPRITPHTWIPLVTSCGLVAGSLGLRAVDHAVAFLATGLGVVAVVAVLSAYRSAVSRNLSAPRLLAPVTSLLPLISVVNMAFAAFSLGQLQSAAAPAPFVQEPREQVVYGRVVRILTGGLLVCREKDSDAYALLSFRPRACVFVRIPRVVTPATWPVSVGDRISVRGQIRAPGPPLNPFDFHEQRWIQSMGAFAVLDQAAALHVQQHASALQALRLLYRSRVAARFERTLATPLSRGLAHALWLGDRSSIPDHVEEAFSDSGLAHVLAVSGLHVGFVAVALLAALRIPLRRLPSAEHYRRRLTGLAAASGLVLFGWWIGPAASVDRAVIMGSALLLSGAFIRKPSPWVAFTWALLLSLFMKPTAWQAVGWQLSFSAVGAILLALPWLSRLRRKPVASALLVTAAAWLGTAPVLVLNFGQSPAAGAALSPIAVPLMAPLLFTTLTSLLDPGPVSLLLTEILAALLHGLARFGMAWPEWTRWSAPPGTWSPSLLLPWMLIWMLRPGLPRARLRRSVAGVWAAVVVILWTPPYNAPVVQQLHVGQGDATIIILPETRFDNGRTIVIDTGPSEWTGRVVAAHVAGWGRQRIDWLIHSHEHADHIGGSSSLARLLPILNVGSQHTLRRGDVVDIGPYARLYVLGPTRHPIRDANNDSVVLRLQVGPRSWLFLGDAEAAAERALLRHMGPMLNVDVVKAGHHGSATSSLLELVDHVSAATVLMSAGRDNRFSHPDSAVVGRWQQSGARVHVTFSDGAWISDQ